MGIDDKTEVGIGRYFEYIILKCMCQFGMIYRSILPPYYDTRARGLVASKNRTPRYTGAVLVGN